MASSPRQTSPPVAARDAEASRLQPSASVSRRRASLGAFASFGGYQSYGAADDGGGVLDDESYSARRASRATASQAALFKCAAQTPLPVLAADPRRRFSRSTAGASKFVNRLEHAREAAAGADASGRSSLEAPRSSRLPLVSEAEEGGAEAGGEKGAGAPRTCHDVSHDAVGFLELVRGSWLLVTCLVVFATAAGLASALKAGPVACFFLPFVALVPLAILLGDLTEGLADWLGPVAGGLLNATLGNATEAIVLVQAVRHGLVGVEQAALLGGVLSNMLLVVGSSFVFGGFASFNSHVATADVGVLFVACTAIILPTLAAAAPGGSTRDALADSRCTAFVLLSMYGAYLYYALAPGAQDGNVAETEEERALSSLAVEGADGVSALEKEEEGGVDGVPAMSVWAILFLLTSITVLMAFLANALVTNVFPVSDALGISTSLVSCIFLPVIGNVAELATAVIAARRGAMDLSLAVALGSATQISLFLLPVAVLLGWAIGVPMSLDFQGTFALAFFASVLIVALLLLDGRSSWMKGAMLLGAYAVFIASLVFSPTAAVAGPAPAPTGAAAAT